MKLFDKVKHGLQGSGVHAEIDGPRVVSSDQPGLDLVVSFRAKEQPVVLQGYVVTLEQQVEEEQRGFNNGIGFSDGVGGFNNGMDGFNNGNMEMVREGPTQVVAQNPAPIDLQPNVPVSFNIQVPLNSFAAAMRAHAGRLGLVLADLAQSNEEIEYFIHLRAPVQGSSHHAHASHTVRVRSFGFGF
jgi:hypothetical protein